VNRSILVIIIALAAAIAPVRSAFADDPKPTPEQLDAAKKAFGEGKTFHDQGKLPEAIEKFKESYRLSKNPLLLYNIGFTLDEAGQKDKAMFYYRKFLSDAPPDAAQRASVTERVKLIEKENLDADLNGPPTKIEPTKVEPVKVDPTPTKIKPPGTYSAADFQHQVVEEAPPVKPLDITAFVPEDSGFVVTLFFRGAGDSKFASKVMKWRYKELVGRIPATKVGGTSIQYYLEVKDQAGTLITKSGKSTSPNLVNIEQGATPRFYPDITDEGTPQVSATEIKHHDDEDPLNHNKVVEEPENKIIVGPVEPEVPGNGFADVGSKKYRYVKWGSTGTAVGMIGLAIGFYVLASNQANALVEDSKLCPSPGQAPPCRPFDATYDKPLQDAGKRYQTLSNVALTLGVAATAVAGYYWYKERRAKKRGELNVTSKKTAPEMTWVVAPAIGDGFTGAAAAASF
jgi:tetratricopeptide (TPR) repeat protein